MTRPRGGTSNEAGPRTLAGSQRPVFCEILARPLDLSLPRFSSL